MNEEWDKLNRAYWDAWKALAESAPGTPREGPGGASAAPPWADAMEAWWRAASGHVPDAQRDSPAYGVFGQVAEQSRHMFAFAEMMRDAFENPGGRPPAEKFAESLRDAIGSWRVATRAAEFALPFMQWPLQPPGAGAGTPNPFAAFGGGAGARRYRLRDDWDPGDFSRSFAEYQQALNAVAEQQFRALNDAVDRFTATPTAKEKPASGGDALKEWYDTWVKCCDTALSELSASEGYSEHFGGLVNSYLKIQQMLWSSEEDDTPEYATTDDTDALGDKLDEVNQRCSGLESRLTDIPLDNLKAHVSELTDEVHELRDALESLRSERASAGAAPSAAAGGAEAKQAARPAPAAKKKPAPKARKGPRRTRTSDDDLDISSFKKS